MLSILWYGYFSIDIDPHIDIGMDVDVDIDTWRLMGLSNDLALGL